jgi:geranylgeranyl pyrophosphate synthase
MLGDELRERLGRLDSTLWDVVGGEQAPNGLDAEEFRAHGGLRLRSLLVLLSARAARAGREEDRARLEADDHVAVAAELLHLATLLQAAALGRHQDGRRRRAARRLLGGAVSWVTGHQLTLRALEVARYAHTPEVLGDLVDAMREVSDGHALSEELHQRPATVDDCFAHADGHTGAVFAFACRAGARMGDADRRVLSSLGRYGRRSGVAWHLSQDLHLLDQAASGRARGLADRAVMHRPNLAVTLAADQDDGVLPLWEALARDADPELADQLVRRVERTGSMAVVRERLVQESWSARKALSNVPRSDHRDALDQLVMRLAG